MEQQTTAREQQRRQILLSSILTDDMKKRALVSMGGGDDVPLIALQFSDVQIRVDFTDITTHEAHYNDVLADNIDDLWTPD